MSKFISHHKHYSKLYEDMKGELKVDVDIDGEQE